MWINKYNLPANEFFLFILLLSSSFLPSSSDSFESSDEAAYDPTVAPATGGSDRFLPNTGLLSSLFYSWHSFHDDLNCIDLELIGLCWLAWVSNNFCVLYSIISWFWWFFISSSLIHKIIPFRRKRLGVYVVVQLALRLLKLVVKQMQKNSSRIAVSIYLSEFFPRSDRLHEVSTTSARNCVFIKQWYSLLLDNNL